MAVPALNPDVAIIHAQQADAKGNVALWGITGIQKEAVLCAKRTILTVAIVLGGAHPSYVHDYYPRDNSIYEYRDPIARDRERFRGWMELHVLGTEDFAGYPASISKREAVSS